MTTFDRIIDSIEMNIESCDEAAKVLEPFRNECGTAGQQCHVFYGKIEAYRDCLNKLKKLKEERHDL